MHYLVLGADVFGIPLHEEGKPPSRSWPVRLSEQLKKEVMEWNERFAPLIAAEHLYSAEDRKTQCAALDEEGKKLAIRIANEVTGGAKVRYIAEKM